MLGFRHAFGRFARAVNRVFPEREFHYRALGNVRYFSLSRSFQAGIALIILAMVGWTGYSTWYFVSLDSQLRGKDIEVAQARRAQREMRREVEVFNQRLQQVAMALESSRSNLNSVAANSGLTTGEDEGENVSAEARQQVRQSQAQLDAQIRILAEARETLNNRSAAIQRGLQRYGNEVETIMSQHSTLTRQNRTMQQQMREMQARLNRMRQTQREVVARLEERTGRSIEEVERVIAMTGLDANDLLGHFEENGQGGPIVEISDAEGEDEELNQRLVQVQHRLRRWENLQRVVRNLPLIAPIDHYRLSSTFGRRRDPMTGRWASHNGLDFAYHINTPVLSTARGTVVYAGWRGGYGWTVEIDHGMGIRTRYAHMRRILVQRGQEVDFRETIGLLGSSGRSTGPHVHYEIIVNGQAENPMTFITAGKYVFKG